MAYTSHVTEKGMLGGFNRAFAVPGISTSVDSEQAKSYIQRESSSSKWKSSDSSGIT